MSAILVEAKHYQLKIAGTSERQVAETIARLIGVGEMSVIRRDRVPENPGYPSVHRVFTSESLRRLGRDLRPTDSVLEVSRERIYVGPAGLTEWRQTDCYGITSRLELPEYVQGQTKSLLERSATGSGSRRFSMGLFGGR